jgi:FkbM family methyltransferase
MVSRFESAAYKLRWGLHVAGPLATLLGAFRTAAILISRRPQGEVHLRSGPVLEFAFPEQFPPTLTMFGDLIDPEFAFLKRVARPNWRVIDVGAAIGQFTLFATMCLPASRVDAFEPSSANIATLKRNLERNGVVERVTVHQAALSDRKETAHFATASKNWMSQLVTSGSPSEGTEEVAVDTLDTVLADLGIGHVNVLKINVAGFEPAVINGAMAKLRAQEVDVMVLLLGLPSLPHYAAIAELGYRFFYYHPFKRTLHEVESFDADAVLNHRPWPARHIIAIRDAALKPLISGRVSVASKLNKMD